MEAFSNGGGGAAVPGGSHQGVGEGLRIGVGTRKAMRAPLICHIRGRLVTVTCSGVFARRGVCVELMKFISAVSRACCPGWPGNGTPPPGRVLILTGLEHSVE